MPVVRAGLAKRKRFSALDSLQNLPQPVFSLKEFSLGSRQWRHVWLRIDSLYLARYRI
jgi:hypothetical protein